MKISFKVIFLVATSLASAFATPSITSVTALQRYPWNGKVDISYTASDDTSTVALSQWLLTSLKVTATDRDSGQSYVATSLSGDTTLTDGTHNVVWDMAAQGLTFVSSNVVFTVSCETTPATYCVIDLSAGANASTYPVTYLAEPPAGGFNVDEYKTTKLALRRIEPGTFMMCGQYQTTLTKPFFIGIFEITQRQYSLIMGSNPSLWRGDKRPVETVSYNTIRGSVNGSKWPDSNAVDSSSFIGKLRTRTGLSIDLPAEAQWEYACRAGTTSSYNNGGNTESDRNKVGRSNSNTSDGKGGYSQHTVVGSYQPNAWGLYDMHGNVWEWCLDWYGDLSSPLVDPKGTSSGTARVGRGGSWRNNGLSSSVRRSDGYPAGGNGDDGVGFRIASSWNTWCVDASSGNDNNGGISWGSAKKTIQSALNLASNGDTILVKPGIYKEDREGVGGLYNSKGVNVSIKSTDGPLVTIIDGDGKRRCAKGTNASSQDDWQNHALEMEGFSFRNGFFSGDAGTAGVAYVKLRNCILSANVSMRAASAAGYSILENCLITGNVASNVANEAKGLVVDGRCQLVNCTIVGNTGQATCGAVAVGDSSTLVNCVIYGNDFGSVVKPGNVASIRNTAVDSEVPGEGNIILQSSPFADFVNGDYSLAQGSVCIDAGLIQHTHITTDLAGNHRARGAGVDLGCYEFQEGAIPQIDPHEGSLAWENTICPVPIDLTPGTRMARADEVIRYSTAWTDATSGATAIVAVNGKELSAASGNGSVEWHPTRNGTYTFTHRVLENSAQVGETLAATFEVSHFPATPVIAPSGGIVTTWPLSVAMSCATEGAAIYYTTDGSEPTADSTSYSRFRITGRTTVKAVAIKDGVASEVAVSEYAHGQCADPVIAPVDGTAFEHVGQEVSIDWQGEDGVLRYTTDGSDPTTNSPAYGGPFTIDDSTIVKAKAFGDQYFDSAIVTANLTRVWVNVETPTIAAASSFTGSETKVVLSCATPGATIRYTLNGNDPNSHSTRYTGPFYVADSCTVKAYAVCDDYLNSAVATFAIEKVWGIGDTVGAPDHTFTTGGDLPFVRVTDSTAPLGESMKSGAITHSQTSTLSTAVMGPGTISFQWKTSCEKDDQDLYEWDHVEFSVDGVIVARLDGVTAWQTVSWTISDDGTHTLLWCYVKDNVESAGEDCCWVADCNWSSGYTATQTTAVPVPYTWIRAYYPHTPGEYDAYETVGNGTAANGKPVADCYIAGLDPTDAEAEFRAVISFANGAPVISWDPKLDAEEEAKRTYTIYGRESLTEGSWGPTNANSRFFKVSVELP